MAQKNWKEKLNDMGIEIKEVRRVDGSVIDGMYTFEYNGILVHERPMDYEEHRHGRRGTAQAETNQRTVGTLQGRRVLEVMGAGI